MIAGVATIIGAFWAGKWSGFLIQLLVGLLYVAASLVVTEQPFATILIMTIFVAVAFMVIGAFRVLSALLIRFPQWGWAMLNGLVTFLAGFVIYRRLPWCRPLGDRAAGGTGNAPERLDLDHAFHGSQEPPRRGMLLITRLSRCLLRTTDVTPEG